MMLTLSADILHHKDLHHHCSMETAANRHLLSLAADMLHHKDIHHHQYDAVPIPPSPDGNETAKNGCLQSKY
jgi:hypothetical protein